jgi:histidine triad (HIT) family protein
LTKDCVFCKIIQREAKAVIIYEDETIIVFLDHMPVNDGHTLIVPKKHYETLMECPAEVYGVIFRHANRIGKQLIKYVNADGLTILQNNGRASNQLVPHLHVHIIPRHLKDGMRPKQRSRQEFTPKNLEEIGKGLRRLFEKN